DRLAMLIQGVQSNYHNDLFMPLIERAAEVVGKPNVFNTPEAISYHVLADHARAVAFLLGEGIFPSNEGRGYVLRRILRRAVRHAWLLGRREPTLTYGVESVVAALSDTYPELRARERHIL